MALEIRYVALATVALWDQNPKRHDMGAITDSIRRYGFRDAPIYDATLGALVAGNGRTVALRDMERAGLPPPAGVRLDADGGWLVPVQVGVDAASASGGDLSLFDMARLWDREMYTAQLEALAAEDALPVSVDGDDLAALLNAMVLAGETDSEPVPVDGHGELAQGFRVRVGRLAAFEDVVAGVRATLDEHPEWEADIAP